jgi:ketosteroid isomerase-like protein
MRHSGWVGTLLGGSIWYIEAVNKLSGNLTIFLRAASMVLLLAASSVVAQEAKPRKHAMAMPGMQMHENHSPASNLRAGLVKAWNASDASQLAGLFAESAVIIPPSGKFVTGQQSIREYLQQKLNNKVHVSFTSAGLDSSPDLQVDFGVFTESTTASRDAHPATEDQRQPGEVDGKYLMVVKRVGADWKIHELVFVRPSKGS